MTIESVAVFCGSNFGLHRYFCEAQAALGRAIADAGLQLIYGGTDKGLMGVLADAALQCGARVHGVITQRLVDKGHLHPKLSSHEIVSSMDERKRRMGALAGGFIAAPGGIGTLDEFYSTWSLAQLEESGKACALHNVNGFYDGFLRFVDGVVHAEFLTAEHRDMLVVEADPVALIERMRAYQAPRIEKWFDPKKLGV